MKPKTIALLVVAITCGLVASYMTSRLLAERGNVVEEVKVKVLTSKTKVPAFVAIKNPENYFEEKELAENAVPRKAITSFDDIRGKMLNKNLRDNQTITPDDVVNSATDGLSADLPPGMRAVSMKVNPETIVGGFVQPKSKVDVVMVMRRGDENSVAKIILQNVLVLAVDVNKTREENKDTYLGTTVTIAAKPEDAQQFALAQALGELRLILRGAGDDNVVTLKDVTFKDIGKQRHDGGTEETPETPVKPSNPGIEIAPPVAEKSENPPVMVKTDEKPPVADDKPVETHIMTITVGADTTKATFIKDEKEGWKSGLNRSSDDTPSPTPGKTAPTAPKAAAPAAKEAESKGEVK